MATTTLNTKIKLRYDTLENWQNVSVAGKGGNLVLLKGEVAFCEVPAAGAPGGKTVAENNPDPNYRPTVLFKVGAEDTNGNLQAFKDLPWGSALAADVYAWAKAASKPEYNATEISIVDANNNITPTTVEAAIADIYATISSITGGGNSSIADQIAAITGTPDTNKTLQDEIDDIEAAIGTPDANKTLQDEIDAVEADIATLNGNSSTAGSVAKAVADEAARIDAITGTPDNGKTLQGEIDAVEADVATLKGDVNTTGSVAKSINDAITGLSLSTTYAGKAYESKVDTLIGNVSGDDAKSARSMAAEEVAKVVAGADTSYDTLKEIADWIQNDTTGAAKMANDITALKTKTELGTYDNNGTPTEYATVKAYVEAAVSAEATRANAITGTPDNGKTLQGEIDDVEAAIATLNGNSSTSGSVAKAVADEASRIDAITGTPDSGKTLQGEIDDVEAAIATLNGTDSTTGSVAKAVKDAVDAIDYTIAANGTNETNKVLTGFEIENGGLKANSVTTTTLANIATTGNVNDLVQTQGDELILDGGDAGIPAQSGD